MKLKFVNFRPIALVVGLGILLALALRRWREPFADDFDDPGYELDEPGEFDDTEDAPGPAAAPGTQWTRPPVLTTSPPEQRVRTFNKNVFYMAPAGELPAIPPAKARGATWLTGDNSLNELYWAKCKPKYLGEVSYMPPVAKDIAGGWTWTYIKEENRNGKKVEGGGWDTQPTDEIAPLWLKTAPSSIQDHVKNGVELAPWLRRGKWAEKPEVKNAIMKACK